MYVVGTSDVFTEEGVTNLYSRLLGGRGGGRTLAAEWGVGGTMAPAVGGAVRPSGETAATNKARPGCVLAAAGLAVAAGCPGVGGTEGLGLYG